MCYPILCYVPLYCVVLYCAASCAALCGEQTFAQGLREHGLRLSVDVAGWSPIWNYDALAQTSADSFISMVSEGVPWCGSEAVRQ